MTLEDQLRRDEGQVLHVYLDSLGIRTAGVGHDLESHRVNLPVGATITQEQSDEWLSQDIVDAKAELAEALPWSNQLDEPRLGALINMTFNMGIGAPGGKHGLLSFHTFLSYLQAGDYCMASQDILHTLWAREVGSRATRLATQIEEGIWV